VFCLHFNCCINGPKELKLLSFSFHFFLNLNNSCAGNLVEICNNKEWFHYIEICMVELPSFNRLIRTMVDTLERAIRYAKKKKIFCIT
jgi:hypothetical protein